MPRYDEIKRGNYNRERMRRNIENGREDLCRKPYEWQMHKWKDGHAIMQDMLAD